MKLCVSQGTFNPIHNAHLRVCEYVISCFDFDKILLIPASKPPHKDTGLPVHRLKMTELAASGIKKLEVSDIEYRRDKKSYTFDTICELYKQYDIEGKIHFLIGTDAFRNIETWYRADELKNLLHFIVFQRGDAKEFDADLKYFEKLRQKGYNYDIMELTYLDVSSTQVRNNVKMGLSIANLVPKSVDNYIKENGLYRF